LQIALFIKLFARNKVSGRNKICALLISISLRNTAFGTIPFSPEWALSDVPIINLNSFKIILTTQQGGMENFDIRVLAARI
jgi:hypothetical protein